MPPEIVVRPEAHRDAAEAGDWYDERVQGLGTAFLDQFGGAINSVRQSPLAYPVYRAEIRRIRLSRFPYPVFYAVDDAQIAVLAVFHLARDPRSLRKILRQRE